MTRHTPDDFLDLYMTLLKKANSKKKGKVEITIKRYDLDLESKLPKSCDKTGSQPASDDKPQVQNTKNTGKGKNKKTKKPTGNAAAKPQPTTKTIDLPPSRSGCIVKAKFDGRKVSCVVPVAEINEFQRQFGNIFCDYSTALVAEGKQSDRLKNRIEASKGKK